MSGWLEGLSGLLGGIVGRDEEKGAIRAQNAYNAPIKVRERAEAAGFNPLLFVGPGVGQQVATGSNVMGSSIASAGLALADGMGKAKMLEIERSRLAMDREKLDALVQNATIRPRSGGIYAGNVSAPSVGGVGGSNAAISAPLVLGLAGGGVVRVGASVTNSDPNGPQSSSDGASKVPKLPLTLFGSAIQPVSNTSDAEAFGSRYGEDFASPGWFAGWGAAAADGLYATKQHFGQRYTDIVGGTKKRMRDNSENMKRKFGADWYQQQAPKAGQYWGQP